MMILAGDSLPDGFEFDLTSVVRFPVLQYDWWLPRSLLKQSALWKSVWGEFMLQIDHEQRLEFWITCSSMPSCICRIEKAVHSPGCSEVHISCSWIVRIPKHAKRRSVSIAAFHASTIACRWLLGHDSHHQTYQMLARVEHVLRRVVRSRNRDWWHLLG